MLATSHKNIMSFRALIILGREQESRHLQRHRKLACVFFLRLSSCLILPLPDLPPSLVSSSVFPVLLSLPFPFPIPNAPICFSFSLSLISLCVLSLRVHINRSGIQQTKYCFVILSLENNNWSGTYTTNSMPSPLRLNLIYRLMQK